ncbi:MAG: hypothetical protein ACI90U_001770 [Pseudomonadales bacterium]|jgi:hypothetical protein
MYNEFQVNKANPNEYRIVEAEVKVLGEGEVRLEIDQFAFTANNLTYAAAGDSLGYWQFFPALDNADNRWGIIPVWAFADVVESNNDAVPVGDRLYGYFPPATSVVIAPSHISNNALVDNIEHRQKLPPLYNRYNRVLAGSNYDRSGDAARILLAPLHMTSFCIWDQLTSNNYYNSEQVIIVSASSKTSLGLAYGLSTDDNAPTVVALTSSRNVDFVAGLGLYQETVSYDSLAETLQKKPSVVIDMAGNAAVKADLQNTFGDNLNYYMSVGITHWEDLDGSAFTEKTDPAKHEMFFAPSYILERMKEWGPAEFDKRSSGFVIGAAMATFGWMTIDHRNGLDGLSELYPAACKGALPPSSGLVIKM